MSTLKRCNTIVHQTERLSLKIFLLLILAVPITVSVVERARASEPPRGTAEQAMAQGNKLLARGAFAESAVHWMEAARMYEQEGNQKKQSQALTHLAYALQQDGQVRKAMTTLQVALKLSEGTGDRAQTAVILGRFGNAAFALGQGDTAVEHLTKALSLAREAQRPAMAAVLLNDLGNAMTLARQLTEAVDVYAESRTLAIQTFQPALAVTALINMAMAFMQNHQYGEAQQKFDLAQLETKALEDSHTKVYGYLNIGLGYNDLRAAVTTPQMMAEAERHVSNTRGLSQGAGPTAQHPSPASIGSGGNAHSKPPVASSTPPARKSLVQQATDLFQEAAEIAVRLGDSRAEAYALGYLGALFEKERRYAEALKLTRKAVFVAQKVDAADSLYQWHWQTARLLKATGNMDGALSAYQRAVTILQPIRYEYSVGYQGRHHSFQYSVAPLFMEFEDVLLRRAAMSKRADETQQLLVQVRDVVELSRMAELQDYYRDDCIANARAKREGSDAIPEHTAVIYPIRLPDRLELLVQTAKTLQRVEVKDTVDAEQLTQQVNDFRAGITDPSSSYFHDVAKTLYDWLLKPLEAELSAHAIHTLVFVPDGPLRTIPIAALHDGKQFAIEKYAIAVTPSMELTDTRSVDLSNATMLSLGLTESRGGFPPLPNVATEIGSLQKLYGGKHILDGQFLIPSVEPEIKGREVGIVHFATHGEMGNEARQSFLLAYDDKISMNRLSQLVGLLQHRLTPLELITLSACETAAGDDRAALGLAGVAVKAGARSAFATLWSVNDKATSEVVVEFYRLLRHESVSKAEALKRAQLKIKSTPGYEHPFFWAPFLLIGNWR